MALTHDDVKRLNDVFAPEDHSILKGFVYLTEEAINDRLTEIDPSFSFEIVSLTRRDGVKPVVTAHCRLTVCDVTRENVGMAVIELTKSGDNEANEAEKSAVTDAFKRCARLFGIGKYILGMGKVNTEADITRWLQKSKQPVQKPKPAPQSQKQTPPVAPADNAPWFEDADKVKKLEEVLGEKLEYIELTLTADRRSFPSGAALAAAWREHQSQQTGTQF